MSTNDTVLLLASGASGISPSPRSWPRRSPRSCHDLARQLLADAEGSTKDIAIEVRGAASEDDAVEVGRAVARSNLVKTALFGNDPNWGRILAAVGTTGAAFEPDELGRGDQRRVGLPGRRGGRRPVQGGPAGRARHHRRRPAAPGRDAATVWTNDLSLAYVHENSAYST